MKNSQDKVEKYKKQLFDYINENTPTLICGITFDSFKVGFFKCATSLRLSYYGFKTLRKYYNNHQFEIKDKKLKCKHFLSSVDSFNAPYYFNEKNFWLFGHYDAFIASMHGWDVYLMLDKDERWDVNLKDN